MMGEQKIVRVVFALFAVLSVFIKEIDCLQCFNCAGITNYDPQSCFQPVLGKTILQECQRGEVCEKKISTVDRLQDAVERGCSSNCDGRTFIWTDSFRVHCCDEENKCNHGGVAMATRLSLLLPVIVWLWTRFVRRIF